jgi:alpha-D-ribose 1-methylphosphonate 5-phosphate C-P lyase
MSALRDLTQAAQPASLSGYRWAYLDEATKREIRRALLKAVCIPGHIVEFASREMPVARGWGSGGLQVTLSTVQPGDVVKVIDQGDDGSLNARNMRGLVAQTTAVATTTDAATASLIQTRHRIPEAELSEDTILVFQVPIADPLNWVQPRRSVSRRMHAEGDYAAIWLALYEEHTRLGESSIATAYPCLVNAQYVMSPTPIPRWDLPRLNQAPFLALFGAGREGAVYAVPPYTTVVPLAFEDRPFRVEQFPAPCARCGTDSSYLVEETRDGADRLVCSDTAACGHRLSSNQTTEARR